MIVNLTSQFSGSVGTPLFYRVQSPPTTAPIAPGKSIVFRSPNTNIANPAFRPAFGGTIVVQQIVSTTFFFRGFYVAGNQYETWQGPSRNTPPPSGHSLIDVTVIGQL